MEKKSIISQLILVFLLSASLSACATEVESVGQPSDTAECLAAELDVETNAESEGRVFILTLRNTCEKAIEVLTNGSPGYDFQVLNTDDELVWERPGATVDIIDYYRLEVGEELTFTQKWEGVNIDGEPVMGGAYKASSTFRGGLKVTESLQVETVFTY